MTADMRWIPSLVSLLLDVLKDFYDCHIKHWSFGELFLLMEKREYLLALLRAKGFIIDETDSHSLLREFRFARHRDE